MSGHSKWAKIKHKKGINDAKKGKIFSKYAQQITVAAKEGGGDPNVNFTLRLLIDKARSTAMPAENIQRAIDRGTGKGGESVTLEHVTYEAIGPNNVSMIIESLTDNKNRTISELRTFLSGHGCSLAESGAVSWNFKRVGLVTIRSAKMKKSEKFGGEDGIEEIDAENLMLELMDIEGIEDIDMYEINDSEEKEENGTYLDIYTDVKALAKVRDHANDKHLIVKSAELVWIPNSKKSLVGESLEKVELFVEELEELEDIQNVWTDLA